MGMSPYMTASDRKLQEKNFPFHKMPTAPTKSLLELESR